MGGNGRSRARSGVKTAFVKLHRMLMVVFAHRKRVAQKGAQGRQKFHLRHGRMAAHLLEQLGLGNTVLDGMQHRIGVVRHVAT